MGYLFDLLVVVIAAEGQASIMNLLVERVHLQIPVSETGLMPARQVWSTVFLSAATCDGCGSFRCSRRHLQFLDCARCHGGGGR